MRLWISLCTLLALSTASVSAQRPGGKAKDTGPLPLLGKELPDVSAYDETGEPFALRQRLKGKHGVIIFGCLT
ncbi:MAG: hypothetical protein CMO55_03990 [Verrucomicrobiales bacterium]|nr:hypothetical protein [Verrucomicrobiales bacterium]